MTSHDESPCRSESPSGSSGSSSENVNKRWVATEVKILILTPKSSKGKKNLYGRRLLTLLLNIAKRLALEVPHLRDIRV